jgi:membrane-associated HD superfamily phosphohydrolase
MNNNSETVLNGTNEQVDTSLGQIRLIETNSGLTIEHHVTKRERLYSEYSNFAVKTAQSTVEMCRVVSEAKKTLSSSEYSEFLNDIGHKSETSTIRKYLAIGEQYDKLIQYTNLLPNSWTSIYTITQLSSDTFDALAATDTDMSKMSGKEIKTLVELDKPKPSSTSACVASTSSVATTQTVPTSSVQSSSDDKHDESLAETDVEQAKSDSVNGITSTYNNQIDVVSTDCTYEVLVRFKSKPSDDSWWDLTEAIEAVVDRKNLNVEIIETRPPFVEVVS